MSKIQKIIIVIYCILVATACVYVPWETRLSDNTPISLGYSPIWEPLPLTYYLKPRPNLSIVDIKRVVLELIAITAVFAILFVLTLKPKKVFPGS